MGPTTIANPYSPLYFEGRFTGNISRNIGPEHFCSKKNNHALDFEKTHRGLRGEQCPLGWVNVWSPLGHWATSLATLFTAEHKHFHSTVLYRKDDVGSVEGHWGHWGRALTNYFSSYNIGEPGCGDQIFIENDFLWTLKNRLLKYS